MPPAAPAKPPGVDAPPAIVGVPEHEHHEDLAAFPLDVEEVGVAVGEKGALLTIRLSFDELGDLPELYQMVLGEFRSDLCVRSPLPKIPGLEFRPLPLHYLLGDGENPVDERLRDPETLAGLEELVGVKTPLKARAERASRENEVLMGDEKAFLRRKRNKTGEKFLKNLRIVDPALHNVI